MQAGVLGSSLLAMVAPSCVGLGQHARLGNVDWRMAAGLAAGTAVGSFAGSKVAVDAPAGKLADIFCLRQTLFLRGVTLPAVLVQKHAGLSTLKVLTWPVSCRITCTFVMSAGS